MTRELEKSLADKVLRYKLKISIKNNGLPSKTENDLLSDFYNYLLKFTVEKISDIPAKYDAIIKS
jgi:hypothetical protein